MTVEHDAPLLQVRNLCKYYPIYAKGLIRRLIRVVKACDQINFDLPAGQTLGLVGESGSGKTTTGRAILRAIAPTSGQVLFNDQGRLVDIARLSTSQLKPLRTRMQMIFQDPFASLNPRMTVRNIVAEPLIIHKMAQGSELDDRVVEMLQKVGLKPEHRTRYPHAFSGGQRQRIGIARALIMRPSLVVADEAVSALDVSVQAQVINLLADLQHEFGLTYLFIAHDLSVVRHICDSVAVMYAGRIVELAKVDQFFEDPQHPYSRALLSAVPNPDPDVPMQMDLPGDVADPGNLPAGCSFHPRCVECMDVCRITYPIVHRLANNHTVACHLYGPKNNPVSMEEVKGINMLPESGANNVGKSRFPPG